MKVGFDLFFRHTISAKRGIGRYGESLLEALRGLNQGDHCIEFAPAADPFDTEAWNKELRRFLAKQRPDIYLIPSPFEFARPLPSRELLGECKLAAVIHDFIPLRYPEQYLGADRRAWYDATVDFLRSCDLLLANSETTKRDALDLAGLDGARIEVIYGGVDPMFCPGAADKTVLEGLGITREYVLYVGAFDFRKNVEGLVRGFGRACRQLPDRPQLVMPSSDASKSTIEKLRKIARADGLDKDDLLFPGQVSDEALIHLYRGAALLALPSLWEGLGFPVLEAMACGTPVLTSDTSSLAEVAGDAALLVDPESVSAIGEAIRNTFRYPGWLMDLRVKGQRRAALFTWAETARRTSAALRELVARK